ncbi:MAG: hypothetical protein M3539_09090 [Acidobacteriota bacterium]|nr:hypothetical protein [Acidobacteriota bacterium]
MTKQTESTLLQALWKSIKDRLENERHRVNEEIRNYPTPIPACDAQFNYLLEEQAKIAQEMDRLKALSKGSFTREDVELIDEFIRTSNYITGDAERTMMSFLASLKRLPAQT